MFKKKKKGSTENTLIGYKPLPWLLFLLPLPTSLLWGILFLCLPFEAVPLRVLSKALLSLYTLSLDNLPLPLFCPDTDDHSPAHLPDLQACVTSRWPA